MIPHSSWYLRTARSSLVAALAAAGSACSDSPTRTTEAVPAQVQVVSGSGQNGTVGVELPEPLIVKVVSDDGRPVPNQLVNFRVAAGGGSVFAGAGITNANGVVQERWTLGTSTTGDQLVEARAVSSVTGAPIVFATFSATAKSGPVALLEPVAGHAQSALAGTVLPTPALVRARDQYGNIAPGVAVTFAVASGGGAILNGTQTTDANGVATAGSWTLGNDAGAQTLSVTSGPAPALTITATARPRAPAQLTRVAGNGQTAGVGAAVAIAPRVLITNAHGDVLPGVAVAFTPGNASGSVSGGPFTTDATGHVSVGAWTLGTMPGAQLLTASVGALTAEFTATAAAGGPASLSKTAGDAQSRPYGTALHVAPSVTVRDAFGNPVPGATVQFAIISGGGSIGATSVTTNNVGGASVGRWTLGDALGVQELRASVAGLPSVTFTATATARVAARILAHPSNPTKLSFGQTVTASVIVVDEFGNPVPGVAVTFSTPDTASRSYYLATGTTLTGTQTATNAAGIATVGSWTPRTCSNISQLVAAVSGIDAPHTMTAAYFSRVPSSIGVERYLYYTLPRYSVDNPYLGRVRVRIYTPCGPGLSGVTARFAVIEGSSRIEPSAVTEGDGSTYVHWAGGTVPGRTTVRVSVDGYDGELTGEVSATLAHGNPARLVKVAGDGQTGTTGTVLPGLLQLRVEDKYGNPARRYVHYDTYGYETWSDLVSVQFTGLNGSGSESFVVDAAGVVTATTPWTLGPTPGVQTVTASAKTLSTAFTAQATAPDMNLSVAAAGAGPLAWLLARVGTPAGPVAGSLDFSSR